MTVFTAAWEHQEQVRHQILLRELKEELTAYRRATQSFRTIVPSVPTSSPIPEPTLSPQTSVATNAAAPRPRLKNLEPRDLLKTVAVR